MVVDNEIRDSSDCMTYTYYESLFMLSFMMNDSIFFYYTFQDNLCLIGGNFNFTPWIPSKKRNLKIMSSVVNNLIVYSLKPQGNFKDV